MSLAQRIKAIALQAEMDCLSAETVEDVDRASAVLEALCESLLFFTDDTTEIARAALEAEEADDYYAAESQYFKLCHIAG